ncbi:hypothetical protein E1200_11570 [Actinomadura sp. GC306]|nr:hypothetical protein E1200_11570 [Actinomadura sp. GC306]
MASGEMSVTDSPTALSGVPMATNIRPADRSDQRSRRTGGESEHVLDVAETTFDLLTRGPAPLSVDGAALGHGLPARMIALDELRAIMLHPSTRQEARDAAWKDMVTRARSEGPAWVIACVGVALPGLKAVVRDRLRRLDNDPGAGTSRVAADLLSQFHETLHQIDLEEPWIPQRLVARSARTVERAYRARVQVIPVDPCTLAEITSSASSDAHVDLLLASAVQQDVITAVEAEIIIMTRLEGMAPSDLVERLRTNYQALMKRRRRAEMCLVAALRDGGLRDDFASLMSKNGM